MTIGSILLALALFILVVLFLARPFLAPTSHEPAPLPHQKLLAKKETLLEQIRLLDFDFETGKVPEESYQPQRAYLLQEAATVLQQIDQLSPADSSIEAQIETAVSQLRQHKPAPAMNGKGGYCHQCGQPVDLEDKFCASCGQKLKN